MNMAFELKATRLADIALQEASFNIWDTKYRLKTKSGEPGRSRHRRHLPARRESARGRRGTGAARRNGTTGSCGRCSAARFPAGRITSNAGAEYHKPATSTINCTVSGTIRDSMHDILDKVHEAGLTLKAGCGIGYEFSTLRPRGAYVSGAGAYTSGPLSFMDIYDKMCFTVSSAGGRRGAQMGTFDVGHPDAMDFIRAKREDGRLRQFNLSLLITDEFMQAVRDDQAVAARVSAHAARGRGREHRSRRRQASRLARVADEGQLRRRRARARRVPRLPHAARAPHVGRHHVVDVRFRRARLRAHRSRQRDEQQLVVRGHSRHQSVRRAAAARRTARACSARSISPSSSRRRSAITRTSTGTSSARSSRFSRACSTTSSTSTACRLPQQRDEIMRKRRHGMGFLGLGSAITLLGMRYGSPESIKFTEDVSRELAIAGWQEGLELAKEKGAGADLARGVRGHGDDAPQTPRDGAPTVGRSGRRFRAEFCTAAIAATCSACARSRRSSSSSSSSTARVSRTTARSRRPGRSRCRSRTTRATASSRRSLITTSAT